MTFYLYSRQLPVQLSAYTSKAYTENNADPAQTVFASMIKNSLICIYELCS